MILVLGRVIVITEMARKCAPFVMVRVKPMKKSGGNTNKDWRRYERLQREAALPCRLERGNQGKVRAALVQGALAGGVYQLRLDTGSRLHREIQGSQRWSDTNAISDQEHL